ncbi:MAG: hypothetical protein PVI28_13140 [Gammaproteobacteria bacterium]|jgi:phenylacetate-CoA ligase
MGVNWRKPIMLGILKATKSPIPGELRLIRSLERKPGEEILSLQNQRLSSLLQHAWQHTEYYNEVLSDCGVVRDGKVNLDRFEDIPFLTKDILRDEADRLRAKKVPKGRTPYKDSSGGSTTGQPARFWQDSYYWDMNIANKLYHFEVLGKDLGDSEMKIWGSERDLTTGTIGFTAKLKNYIYNRRFEQCFHLPEEQVVSIVNDINRFKPKIIWTYRDGMDVIAGYILRNGLRPHSPVAIYAGGATLYPHIVERIEKAFRAPVINFYGSRELGDVACQCEEKGGLHIASMFNKVEVIDEAGNTLVDEDGELVVTALMNYTMPFIRYRVGDMGKLTSASCPCGRGWPMLEHVSGRVVEVLINSKGDRIDPIYMLMVGSDAFADSVQRYQIVQEELARITVRSILAPGVSQEQIQPQLKTIREKIRFLMGEDCVVDFEFVDDIPLTKSGKHPYIVRKVSLDGPAGVTDANDRPHGAVR